MSIRTGLTSMHEREPIAIIGIGCRFPGDANDTESFWKLLRTGVDAITTIPEDRWSIEEFYHPVSGIRGKTYSQWGGFIKGIDQFEPECFGISPREAAYIDPQQRLLLEVAWEGLEDGGQVIEQLAGTNTGVFVGISTTDYAQIQSSPYDNRSIDAHSATGGAASIVANRISFCLNLRGPSLAVDTACSSSLVATHLACQSLWNRECNLALAGGVNVIIIPQNFIGFCAASMLSPDGRCKAFDASANGFVRSEGAGVVVLKPLSKALADGDPVYALIVGSAVNQDGRTGGIAAPSQAAQAALLREVYRQAGIAPQDVHYVEAHGTGTAIGDPIEAHAFGNVLSPGRAEGKPCVIGSVKTNIGHAEAAAGIAGLIKTALVLKHRMIPPSLHFHTPNPKIPFEELQLRVPGALEPWPETAGPAVAGVNSFGFGGTNAHLVMMEYQGDTDVPAATPQEDAGAPLLLPLSARSPEALQTLARSYRDTFGRDGSDVSLEDLCYTAGVRRMHLDHRLSLVVHTREDLLEQLEAFLDGARRPGMFTGRRVAGDVPKLVFVCSGQGQQWWGMGRQLLEKEPVFRTTIETCDRLLQQYADWRLLAELTADESSSRMQETAIAQPAIFALQVALAALWRSWGIEPDAVVGHSVGEVSAACIAGALRLEDAVRVIFHRSRCMDRPSSQGKMLAVGLPRLEAAQAIQGYEDRVSLAAINSPSSATLSGEPQALEQIAQSLSAKDIFCRFLHVNYAFHSPRMEPVKDDLLAVLDGVDLQPTTLPMISTVTGKPVDGQQLNAHYWWQNIRQGVCFAEAVEWLGDQGADVFVELSAHPVLSGAILECLQQHGRQATALPSLRQQEEEQAVMLGSLGALFTRGYPLDWQRLYPRKGRCVRLPKYPWQRQHYWHEQEELKDLRLRRHGRPLLGRNRRSAEPSWELVVDKRVLTYLNDHRVKEQAVFPAAAYLEMALEAARENLGEGTCILEEIQFQRALFLPDSDDTPTLQLSVYDADGSFAIHSRTTTSEQSWMLHTHGYIRAQQDSSPPQPVDLRALKHDLPDQILSGAYYGSLADIGLCYGPSFQGITRVWRRTGEALGQIRLADHLEPESKRYSFHPALLDACFQVFFGAVPQDISATNRTLYLPVWIERVRFYRSPGPQVWSHVCLTNANANVLEGNLQVYDEEGGLVLEIEGFTCQAMRRTHGDVTDDLESWFYDIRWSNKPLPEQPLAHREVNFIPSSRELAQPVGQGFRQSMDDLGWSTRFSETEGPLDLLCTAYIAQAMRDLGWRGDVGDRITVAALQEQLPVASQYQQLMGRFMLMLEKVGYLESTSPGAWIVRHMPTEQDPQTLWQHALLQYPVLLAELSMIGRCGSHLAAVLRGDVDPLHLLFPEGSTTTAEHFYQDSPHCRLYNMMVQQAVSHALHHLPEGRTVRILEVGAGIGGMTTYVLPTLPADRTEYVFSDISPLFLSRAEQKFRSYPFVEFRVLDIEQDPLEQGFKPHTFDLILASDVLHATIDVREALGHVRQLLASEGLLVLLEVEKTAASWLDLVFGLTEGWWRFRDADLRSEYPLLPRQTWKAVLQEAGYTDVIDIPDFSDGEDILQVVLLARGPHIQLDTQDIGLETEFQLPQVEQGSWLIFADRSGVAQRLVELLTSHGEACMLVTPGADFRRLDTNTFHIAPDCPEDMEQLLQAVSASHQPTWRGVIHLWSLDAPASEDTSLDSLGRAEVLGCHCIMHFVQALSKIDTANSTPRLILVTRNAQPMGNGCQPVSVGQSPLVGLGRIINLEHPEMRCKMVDLGPDNPPDEIRLLFAELWTEDPEQEIALRHGARFVPRLERATPEKLLLQRPDSAAGSKTPYRLELSASGVIDNLTLRETTRHQPGPGQVEIEVHAAALNFRDVLKALALYPSDSDDATLLGDECAGTIVAVGEGVENFHVGDAVVAIAPASFASYVTTLAALVMHKPAHLTFEEAVTIPIAFLTAYYALCNLGQMQAGERVLIQAATGGVGLAALQIAQHAGAEVFATAGNPEKRELLQSLGVQHVMDSRSLAFADQIMASTGGQGVDIVLNSLAGKALAKGVSCLAPYGRFLELGKRDIYQNSKVGLWAFRKNLAFFAIDLSRILADKPACARSILEELSQRIQDRTYHPLPHRVFPVSRITDAFRYLAQARQIGKVVVSMQEQDLAIEPMHEGPMAFRPDATYLITGGLGGLGITIAKWIIENGGRHVVLMSRSGAASDDAQEALQELQETGARVMVVKADVTRAEQVADALATIDRTMPPLRGIFHAAMVLDDGLLLQLSQQRFRQVMAPKMDGAWNLHAQTLHMPLDFFVLCSSASSLSGNQGQANYVAANTFLDAFAYYRRSLGLPAMTLNWGHVSQVGYVSRHQELAEFLTRRGFLGFSPQQAMTALGCLLQRNPIQMGVMYVDWQKVSTSAAQAELPQRLSSLIGTGHSESPGGEEGSRLREALLHAKPEERREIVQTYIREQVARVLGAAADKLDADRPLNELGLDSLMAVELKNLVESSLGLSLPTRVLMEGPSINRLTEALLEQQGTPVPTPSAASLPDQETAQQLSARVDQLSDEEVDSFLRELTGEEVGAVEPAEEEARG